MMIFLLINPHLENPQCIHSVNSNPQSRFLHFHRCCGGVTVFKKPFFLLSLEHCGQFGFPLRTFTLGASVGSVGSVGSSVSIASVGGCQTYSPNSGRIMK